MQIIYPQSPIPLDDVELVIDGDIENDEYITNAMDAIKKYYNVSILMHFLIHIIINYFNVNNNVLLLQMSAQPAPSPLVVPSTSHNHIDRRTPSPLPPCVQSGGSSSQPSVLGYTLHPKRVYVANKFGVKGVDFKIA